MFKFPSIAVGQPDLAVTTSNDFVGPASITLTVKQYARAGVAALHIEDQVQPKRCGHLLVKKKVVSREEFLTRVRSAVLVRNSIPGGSDLVRRVEISSLLPRY